MTVGVLVPISGGKDSQACLKLALLIHPTDKVRGLFCDTQFEHPQTYEHIAWMQQRYGVVIDAVTAGSVPEQCLKHKRFPSGTARFCTEELKIRPTKRYCKALAQAQGEGFEVWYGMRSDESHARRARYADKACDAVYAPHEVMPGKYPQYLAALGVRFRLAILDWSTEEVLRFLDGEENPLYAEGFNRVGCFPCLAAGDAHKERAFNHDAVGREHYIAVQQVSDAIGKSIWTSKGGKARNADGPGGAAPGCLVCAI